MSDLIQNQNNETTNGSRKKSWCAEDCTKHIDLLKNEAGILTSMVDSQRHLLKPTDHNPQPNDLPPPIAALAGNLGERHVIVIIGLPCVGKTFTASRIQRYLRSFHGADCRRFDVCEYERQQENIEQREESFIGGEDGDTDRAEGRLLRDVHHFLGEEDTAAEVHMKVEVGELDDVRKKHVDSGRVAVIYASDCTQVLGNRWSGGSKEGRRWIQDQLQGVYSGLRVKLIFVEIICTNQESMKENLLQVAQAQESDPVAVNDIVAQWEGRVAAFRRVYVSMQNDGTEDDLSYIKVINYGQKVVTNKMHGYLQMRIVQFVSNIHTKPHVVYLSRHGQSEYNRLGKLGGNPGLTDSGDEYATNLAEFANENICHDSEGNTIPARLWTSSLQRTIDTARHIAHPVICGGAWQQMSNRVYRNLDEIFAGEYEGMTYDDIEKMYNGEATLRKMDKIGYRYPRGESYFDLIARLDPLIHELESYKEPILIVSHQATLRIIFSYLMGIDREHAPKQSIPLHTVLKITYGGTMECKLEQFPLGPGVDEIKSAF